MVPESVSSFLETIALFSSAVGLLLITYGILEAVLGIVRTELGAQPRFQHYEATKRVLIQKIILALDFLVAADLIRLAVASSPADILNTALIVAIRTVLSWSLSREVRLNKE